MDLSRPWLRAPVALLGLALALLLAACGGGGGDARAATPAPAGSRLNLAAGPVQVAAAGTPGTLSDADRAAIIATLRSYVTAATIDPLHGKPVGNLAKVLTPQALASLTGTNRDAVVDESLPKATTTVTVKNPPVALTALGEPNGSINLVGAPLFLVVQTKASGGPVKVVRTGEVVLSHDAGTWKIASYKLSVERTGAGLPAPSKASTEKTAP
jgi:hypothetical protein